MRAFIVLVALGSPAAAFLVTPEQVHVTLGRDPTTAVNVQWHLKLDSDGDASGAMQLHHLLAATKPAVKYWPASEDESTAHLTQDGKTWPFTKELTDKVSTCESSWDATACLATDTIDATSVVYVAGLMPNTLYKYRVSADGGATNKLFSVKTQPVQTAGDPRGPNNYPEMTYALWGDLGDFNGQARPIMEREALAGKLDMVLHVGDFAYNFNSDDGKNGDAFMRDMENLYAYVPTMPLPGNHEDSAHFNQYTQRFRGVASNTKPLNSYPEFANQNMTNSWYYSFQTGYLNVIYFSSELYFDGQYRAQRKDQYDFIVAELKKANTPEMRAARPWLVLAAHRPMYCSADGDCDGDATNLREGVEVNGTREHGLEQLFHDYGVDLFVCGHIHNYERTYEIHPKWNAKAPYLSGWTEKKTVNPRAVTHYLTGAAGNVERHEHFTRPAAFWDASRVTSYGWSRMTVANGTHMKLEFVQTDSWLPFWEEGKVADSVWLVQEHHGMRSSSVVAAGVAAPVSMSSNSKLAVARPPALAEAVEAPVAFDVTRPRCKKPSGSSLGSVTCLPRTVGGVDMVAEAKRFQEALRQRGFWQATRDFVPDDVAREGVLVV